MVDIGVAGDEDDIARIPAERVHLDAGHRQERRSNSAARPFRDGRKQIGWGAHWAVLYRKTLRPALWPAVCVTPGAWKTSYFSITCDGCAKKTGSLGSAGDVRGRTPVFLLGVRPRFAGANATGVR